jgi:alanine-synthesizing transaminase
MGNGLQTSEKLRGVSAEQVFIGNGVSELIDLSLRALLNAGDEVLVPSPDYPLWSAAVSLNGATPRYYDCDSRRGFQPDLAQIEVLINSKTRVIVVINPNNPSGTVYGREVLQRLAALAAEHEHVLVAPGSSFNTPYTDHFRITTLPDNDTLNIVFDRIDSLLEQYA